MSEPSVDAKARLAAIREHCDQGLRYHAWALKRMPSIPEQVDQIPQVQSSMHALAIVLAYVEGAQSERDALLAAGKIASRYEEAVETEGWEPSWREEGKRLRGS